MTQNSLEQTPLVGLFDVEAPSHVSDVQIVERLENIIADFKRMAGGEGLLLDKVGMIIRTAIDYVVDAPTLYRYFLSDLEPDEKTTIGKRIERQLRFELELKKGQKLDIELAGEDVDIKTTSGRSWMFAPNNCNHINLLISYDDSNFKFSLGFVYVTLDDLGQSNRDQKRGLLNKGNIVWIIKDASYPRNFLQTIDMSLLEDILSRRSGMQRVMHLLRSVNGVPISRHAICSVGNQKDALRRTRSNGGARDKLWEEGILSFSGKYQNDSKIVKQALNIQLGEDETLTLPRTSALLTEELIWTYASHHNLDL